MYNQFTLQHIAWQEGASLLQEVREAACKLGILNPTEMKSDDMDERCRHALALSKDGHAVGCVRITPEGKIERMAVLLQEYRMQIETALIEAALIEMLNDYSSEHRLAKSNVAKTNNESQFARLAA